MHCLASQKIFAGRWIQRCIKPWFTFSRNAQPFFINFGWHSVAQNSFIWGRLSWLEWIQLLDLLLAEPCSFYYSNKPCNWGQFTSKSVIIGLASVHFWERHIALSGQESSVRSQLMMDSKQRPKQIATTSSKNIWYRNDIRSFGAAAPTYF